MKNLDYLKNVTPTKKSDDVNTDEKPVSRWAGVKTAALNLAYAVGLIVVEALIIKLIIYKVFDWNELSVLDFILLMVGTRLFLGDYKTKN